MTALFDYVKTHGAHAQRGWRCPECVWRFKLSDLKAGLPDHRTDRS